MKSKIRVNKYIKIKIHTYDEKLKELIKNRIEQKNYAYEELKRYCEDQISLQIPTWQVAAKKAGWIKPGRINTIINLGK